MSTVSLEKGQYMTLTVSSLEELPSKNPSWDSRWLVKGTAKSGGAVSLYVGNKAMTQQCGRMGLENPTELAGKLWTMERTVEGYFNLLSSEAKVKPGSVDVTPAGSAEQKRPERVPDKFESEVPYETDSDLAAKQQASSEEALEAQRAKLRGDMWWALTAADEMVGTILAAREVPFTPECVRSVVALAATLHISVAQGRR